MCPKEKSHCLIMLNQTLKKKILHYIETLPKHQLLAIRKLADYLSLKAKSKEDIRTLDIDTVTGKLLFLM